MNRPDRFRVKEGPRNALTSNFAAQLTFRGVSGVPSSTAWFGWLLDLVLTDAYGELRMAERFAIRYESGQRAAASAAACR